MPRGAFFGLALALSAVAHVAAASVVHDGEWPAAEKGVSLELHAVPRAEAVRKLAAAAGWSVVIHAPEGDTVDVSVKDQPPAKVLDLLLNDRAYVAKRDGSLLSIEVDAPAPPPPASAQPPAPPPAPPPSAEAPADAASSEGADAAQLAKPARARPAARGKDRSATGSNLTIEKSEVAHDVAVLGGNVDVYGTVTGDVSVTGGGLHVHEGGWILGDAVVVGGMMTVDDDAQVDGDVSAIGGVIHRADKAVIGGSVASRGSDDDEGDDDDAPADQVEHDKKGRKHPSHGGSSFLDDLGGAFAHAAMLFVFGAVLLALGARRMELLRVEAASRPMRSFAVGVVGSLAGVVLFLACCVTLVGIPVAIIGLLLAVFGAYAGICAVLTVAGHALLRHRTKSPYVHLAVGCALFMVLGAIPFVGKLVVAAVVLLGIGVLVATRGAGFVKAKGGRGITAESGETIA